MELTSRPTADYRVRPQIIANELYLVKGSDAYVLGDIERRIWDLCGGQTTLEEISAIIASSFDVDPITARRDVIDFVSSLEDAGLIE